MQHCPARRPTRCRSWADGTRLREACCCARGVGGDAERQAQPEADHGLRPGVDCAGAGVDCQSRLDSSNALFQSRVWGCRVLASVCPWFRAVNLKRLGADVGSDPNPDPSPEELRVVCTVALQRLLSRRTQMQGWGCTLSKCSAKSKAAALLSSLKGLQDHGKADGSMRTSMPTQTRL